jgi:lipoyl(octanoyl) transferase
MTLRQQIRPALCSTEPVAWQTSAGLVAYPDAVGRMEREVESIRNGRARDLVWLLEHPPLYTAGSSAREQDLLAPGRLPVFKSGRGGQYTYHGPGQRVAYVMLDLRRRGGDVRAFIAGLEQWLIQALALLGVEGERREDRVGVWVGTAKGEAKIAAIGVRLRHWVSLHGISLNVIPDLTHFDGIVPCGVKEHGVTSLAALGLAVTMKQLDLALQRAFTEIFGPVDPVRR